MTKVKPLNKEYWKRRMSDLEDDQYQRSADYYKDVQRQYIRATNSIQMDISQWYQRLADNNDISYAGAKRLLKKGELEEFKWTVEDYIKAGKENAVDERWMKELENASARHHISYLEAMKIQMQQHAELLSTEFEGGITDYLHKAYGRQYYHTAFEVAKGTGIGSNLARLDIKKVDAIIKHPWAQDGANFSDRIWNNKDKLVRNLHTELTQNIICGTSPQKAIDSLSKTMEVSRSQAGRLIMTESAAISSVAQKACLKDLGVEKYEILATLDSHTSDICQDMDGKVFDMKDYKVGETAPPFHPNCRSTTVPYFDDEFTAGDQRAARDGDGETYYVPADMKYHEWEKNHLKPYEKEAASDIIKVPDFSIGKSIGAKTRNYEVVDKSTGISYHFAEGTKIQNAEVFAGKGTRTSLHEGVAEGLTAEFGGDISKWQHCKGRGVLIDEESGEEFPAEVHWFQEESAGKVKFKVKRWLEDEG